MKKIIYNLIVICDKIFIFLQFNLINILSINKKKYALLIEGSWGHLIQGIFYLNLLDKKNTKKVIVILDYEKFNTSIQDFSQNCQIFKIYSIFFILNRDFSQYPKEFEIKIKEYLKKTFHKAYFDIDLILYNKQKSYPNAKILSKYISKKISKQKIFSWQLHSLNDTRNGYKRNFFKPNYKSKKKISKIFNLRINEIKNSILISVRQRNKVLKNPNFSKKIKNKIYRNISPFKYLRDGNIKNFKIAINYLLKNTNYKIFLNGDINGIDINHKNFFTYKDFKRKTSKNFYRLSLQTLCKFHISNTGGISKIMQFNNCKFLFLDAWPPIIFTPNSIFLYKRMIYNNKNINCYDYLKMYKMACEKQKDKNSFLESLEIYEKFRDAKNYKIIPSSENQILRSLDEFLILISNKKRLNIKNDIYKKVPKYIQKILTENNCLISSGNLEKKN